MTLRSKTTRVSTSRWTPRLEALEPRHLFAVSAEASLAGSVPVGPAALVVPGGQSVAPGDLSTLSVVETTPRDGSILHASPPGLNVRFNQPFPTYLLTNDIGLQRVNANGTIENLNDLLLPSFDLPFETSDLPVTLSGVLTPGRYQIVVLGSQSNLTGLDRDDQPGAPLINRGFDQVVSTFTVAPDPGVETPTQLSKATDLGMVGPVPIVTAASLDLDLGFGRDNSQFYKFTLAPGHFWRLGAEVTAQRDGGRLNAVLTLHDANGKVLKTADLGRADAPFDPYLFAGLQPGTYYLSVSNALGELVTPGESGPADARSGSSSNDGNYRLHVLANTADSATTLLDSQLIYSDPMDPRPTGIVLVFSGPMDLASFKTSTGPGGSSEFRGLELVDDKGRSWSLTLTSFIESNSQYSFLFSKPLPKGRYTLRTPALNGVTDLAGRAPVAAGTKPGDPSSGNLTSWTVANNPSAQAANNLGTILSDASAAVTRTNTLAPNASAHYRFVVPADGYYTITTTASSESFLILIRGSKLAATLQAGPRFKSNSITLYLTTGVYALDGEASGSAPVKFSLALYRQSVSPDAIFDNGVGQGSALNLTLITPVPLPTSGPGSGPNGPPVLGPDTSPSPTTPGPLAPASPPPGISGSSMLTTVSPSAGNGLVLTLGNGLIGSPTAGAEQVTAVGPGTRAGTTALAANTAGVLQGIQYGQSLSTNPSNLSGVSLLNPDELTLSPLKPPGSAAGALVAVEPPIAPSGDEREIASPSDWLGGLGTMLLHGFWLDSGPQTPIVMEPGPLEPVDRIVIPRDDVAVATPSEQVEHADLAAPLGVGLLSVLALRLQQPIRRWIERRRIRATTRRASTRSTVRGPDNRV